ncbi:MAG: glycoside hydrolase family 13 protein [Saccharofermentans sp.]|nr:glycoside hydrolase family 13 protein [Saccharofermentans sp.]
MADPSAADIYNKNSARDVTFHASRLTEYRDPLGACPADAQVSLCLDVEEGASEVTLCYTYGLYSFSYHEEPMHRLSVRRFRTELKLPHEPGILFYWFRYINSEVQTVYYAASEDKKDGEGTIYSDPPRVGPDEDKYPFAFQITVYKKDFVTPDAIKGAVIYQIFPDRFRRDAFFDYDKMVNAGDRPERIFHRSWYEDVDIEGKPETGYLACDFYGGSLDGICEKLDYIKSLGTDIIYLNPIFCARSSHRYDTADYLNVDPILGGNSAFSKLVSTAAAMGIKVIIDGVFSHTGADSIYFNKFGRFDGTGAYESYCESKESPYRTWYNFYKDENGNVNYDSWWGFPDLPNVNEDDLAYRNFVFGEDGVVDKWTKEGAGGIRLDVSDELPDSFIRQMRDTLKEKTNGEGILIGEVWEDASNKCSYGSYRDFILGNTHDSVMGYPFRKNLLDYLCGYIGADVLDARLEGYRERYPAEAYFSIMNLVSSHDVPRILTALSKPCDTDDRTIQKDMKVDPSIFDDCVRLSRIAFAIQIGYIGSASIYYGDEVLMEGYKDPFNRRTYPWERLNLKQVENLMFTRRIARLRTDNGCLRTGFYRTLAAEGGLFVFERFLKDGKDFFGKEVTGSHRIALFTNISCEPVYISVDDRGDGLAVKREDKLPGPLIDRYIIGGVNKGRMEMGLAPRSFVFVIY